MIVQHCQCYLLPEPGAEEAVDDEVGRGVDDEEDVGDEPDKEEEEEDETRRKRRRRGGVDEEEEETRRTCKTNPRRIIQMGKPPSTVQRQTLISCKCYSSPESIWEWIIKSDEISWASLGMGTGEVSIPPTPPHPPQRQL